MHDIVAPFTGAWIEISMFSKSLSVMTVAPFTGAWIEIFSVFAEITLVS